jgi:hypothetical protein
MESYDENSAIDIFQKCTNFNSHTTKINFGHLHNTKTFLIIACENKLSKLALNIVNMKYYDNLEHKDNFGKTALNYATVNGMKDVVIKILKRKIENKKIDAMIEELLSSDVAIEHGYNDGGVIKY